MDTLEKITTYENHYKDKFYRDLTPTDLGRLFEELAADINASRPKDKRIQAMLTNKEEVLKMLKNKDFWGRKDGNEKLLAALESVDSTLWQVLLQKFRGKSGEDLVAGGIIEAVLKSGLMEEKEKVEQEEVKRDVERTTETRENVIVIYAVTAPTAVTFMRGFFKDIYIEENEELKTRVENFKALLEALSKTRGETGQVWKLTLSKGVMSAVAGELDRLHAKDEELAVEIGNEENETVYSVCDARRKKVILKTTDGTEHEFLAASIGEVIDKTISKEQLIKQVKKGKWKWFEFKSREAALAPEKTPKKMSKYVFATLMFFMQILTQRGTNILMPWLLRITIFQIADIDRAAALAGRDLNKKDGFAQAGIKIKKIALAEEFLRPNSYLRQQYRRMAQNPGNLKFQAEFARSIVRFMIKYEASNREKIETEGVDEEGWTAEDRNRMIIMYFARLVENLNSIPRIEDFARPETGYEILENKKRKKTKILGNVSILAIIIYLALKKGQKKVLGMRGTAGSFPDYLKRNHFIIDDNIREEYFKRIIKLRMGAAALKNSHGNVGASRWFYVLINARK